MELLIRTTFTFVVSFLFLLIGRCWGYDDGYTKGFDDGQKAWNDAYRRFELYHDNF